MHEALQILTGHTGACIGVLAILLWGSEPRHLPPWLTTPSTHTPCALHITVELGDWWLRHKATLTLSSQGKGEASTKQATEKQNYIFRFMVKKISLDFKWSLSIMNFVLILWVSSWQGLQVCQLKFKSQGRRSEKPSWRKDTCEGCEGPGVSWTRGQPGWGREERLRGAGVGGCFWVKLKR